MDAEKLKDTLDKPQIKWQQLFIFVLIRKHAFIGKDEKYTSHKKGKENLYIHIHMHNPDRTNTPNQK